MLATLSTIHDPNWYPNTGATHHMKPDPLNLMEKIDYGGSDKVTVGNGSGLHINHVGKSCFVSYMSSQSFYINKSLHMPAITKNLLSVSQFAKDNQIFFEFHLDYYCVKCQDSKEIILQGIADNGLYKFSSSSFKPVKDPVPTTLLSSAKRDSTFHLWHSKLGHPSPIPSINGSRYYIHFINAISKYWIYLVSFKSQLRYVFFHFQQMVEL